MRGESGHKKPGEPGLRTGGPSHQAMVTFLSVGVLHGVDQRHAVFHRFLERLAPRDQAHAPARLLITAVRTDSCRSFSPAAPPELISPARPM